VARQIGAMEPVQISVDWVALFWRYQRRKGL
jgi:hypothetical protein